MNSAPPSFIDMMSRMSVPGIFPDMSSFSRGEEMEKYGKYPIVVSDYKVDVFDMSDKAEREKYSKLMLDLFKKVQAAKCTICRNELQYFDGRWKRYLEWFEYSKNETSTTTKIPRKDGSDV